MYFYILYIINQTRGLFNKTSLLVWTLHLLNDSESLLNKKWLRPVNSKSNASIGWKAKWNDFLTAVYIVLSHISTQRNTQSFKKSILKNCQHSRSRKPMIIMVAILDFWEKHELNRVQLQVHLHSERKCLIALTLALLNSPQLYNLTLKLISYILYPHKMIYSICNEVVNSQSDMWVMSHKCRYLTKK